MQVQDKLRELAKQKKSQAVLIEAADRIDHLEEEVEQLQSALDKCIRRAQRYKEAALEAYTPESEAVVTRLPRRR